MPPSLISQVYPFQNTVAGGGRVVDVLDDVELVEIEELVLDVDVV